MTLKELQILANRLSNSGWCRYWVHRNYGQNPVKMAIQVLSVDDEGFFPEEINDMERLGFQVEDDNVHGDNWIYTIDRTNEDGTPYFSQI